MIDRRQASRARAGGLGGRPLRREPRRRGCRGLLGRGGGPEGGLEGECIISYYIISCHIISYPYVYIYIYTYYSSPRLKNTSARQVVLDTWFPLNRHHRALLRGVHLRQRALILYYHYGYYHYCYYIYIYIYI